MRAPFHIATFHSATIEWTAQEVDSTAAQPTPYDSVWSQTGMPVQESTGIERQLLKEDKLYAVLAVVLIIWLGIALFLIRTDRRLDRLERRVDNEGTSTRSPSEQPPSIE